MSENCEEKPGLLFVCYLGAERSRAAAEAFSEIGAVVGHFIGGTSAMAGLSVEEIKQQIPPQTNVLLIYDQGSGDSEYKAKEVATEKLKKAGICYDIIDSPELEILLRERGKELSDYLY